jgi:hypothetical protein
MQSLLPIGRNPSGRPRNRLLDRVMSRRREARSRRVILAPIVVKPVLTRLEARNDRVTRFTGVVACVLLRRVVTAADVTALCAPTEVEPPAADGFTLDASGATRIDGRIDLKIRHARPLCSRRSCQFVSGPGQRKGLGTVCPVRSDDNLNSLQYNAPIKRSARDAGAGSRSPGVAHSPNWMR